MLTLENVQTSRYNAFHSLWAMEQGRRKRRQKLTRSHSVRTHFLSQRNSGQVPPFPARPSLPIFCFQFIKLSEESQKWPIRHLLRCEPDLVRKSHAFHIFLRWKEQEEPMPNECPITHGRGKGQLFSGSWHVIQRTEMEVHTNLQKSQGNFI